MIQLHKINKKEFYLNAELIEQIEATPDTVLTLVSGKTVMVADTVDAVIKKIIYYRQSVYSSASKTVLNSVKA